MEGMSDLQGLLAQAQQIQDQLESAQEQLAQTTVQGSAGSGLVTATVTGLGDLVDLSIAPSAADPDDTETLAALVLAAVRDATQSAQALQQQSMGPFAEPSSLRLPEL